MSDQIDERFGFGNNWQRFLLCVNEDRILEAMKSLQSMLKIDTMEGLSFLDIGCGSGLFSVAAIRLGAKNVMSFDLDPDCVACAAALKEKLFPDRENWEIRKGDALDENFMLGLGQWDVVYAWGVLHHTGNLQKGLLNTIPTVKPSGKLFLAIYNDQGFISRIWGYIKKTYNVLPPYLRFLVVVPCFIIIWGPIFFRDLLKGNPAKSWLEYIRKRGMSPWYDVVDWVGGYPFEVARPEEIFRLFYRHGFQLAEIVTTNRLGNNEFVFIRS